MTWESPSAVRFTDCDSVFPRDPTDESVGYCHSSARADWWSSSLRAVHFSVRAFITSFPRGSLTPMAPSHLLLAGNGSDTLQSSPKVYSNPAPPVLAERKHAVPVRCLVSCIGTSTLCTSSRFNSLIRFTLCPFHSAPLVPHHSSLRFTLYPFPLALSFRTAHFPLDLGPWTLDFVFPS